MESIGRGRPVTPEGLQQNDELFTPQNPFMNPYILEMLLSFLPVVDLRNCRLVNSNWDKEIVVFLNKAKSVSILENEYNPAEQLLTEKSKGKNIYLTHLECKSSNCSNQLFDKLILRLGIHIHKLVLDRCELNVNSFSCLLLSDPHPFPHLNTLVLSRIFYHGDPQGRRTIFIPDEEKPYVLKSLRNLDISEVGPSETTLKNIAIMCPNLKKLALSSCPCPNPEDFKNSGLTLSFLESLQLAPDFSTIMCFEYFESLTYLQLKSLKTIFFYCMTPGGVKRMKSLKQFLLSVSPTLENLHLGQRIMFNPEYKNKSASPFPVALPNLTRMSIGPGFINSMKFFNKLPKLSSFTCTRTKSGDWTKVVKKGAPNCHNAIRMLDLGDVNHIPLTKLGPLFPNIVKLELNLSRVDNHDEVVRAIFGNFPRLQSFSFYDLSSLHRLTDSGITGIPLGGDLKLIKNNPGASRMFPYIGNLRYLIDLRLQYLSGQLTDASVEFGIQDIPSLYALDMSNSQITDLSLEIIARRLSVLTMLYIRNCTKITSEGIAQFKKVRSNVQLRY